MILPKSDSHFNPDGSYQPKTILKTIGLTEGRNLVIDIGAHVGFWSKEFVKVFDQVISIEPIQENFDCLVKNVPEARHIHAACGEKTKKVSFHNPSPLNSGAWEARDGDSIDCITVDSLNVSPDLIKIDVQGYEWNVLEGSVETLKRSRPVLCVEVVFHKKENKALIQYIESLGYQIAGIVGKDRIFKPA